jgi:hypothetical protein
MINAMTAPATAAGVSFRDRWNECVGEIKICVREPQHVAHNALPNYNI